MKLASLLDEFRVVAESVTEAVLPLLALFLVFQALFLKLPRRSVLDILTGTLMAAAGLLLFLVGVEMSFMPFGRSIGEAIGAMPEKWLLAPIGFLLGFVTTWSEPAVRIFADQVEEASTGSISAPTVLYTVSIGVALSVALGLFRIAYGIPLLFLLAPGYVLVIVIMWLCEKDFVAIAVDAGGVATGPMANTFLLALALGAADLANGNTIVEGLGLVSLIALAPMVSVMTLGLLVRWTGPRQE
ncbi:DUF1538 domain-containing protein [Methylocystis sp. H62]|uniref:DUF1538 domain-containing protein n=1 Tax=Methylocystis rosea TaxID=173366 RepID=A0A3G8MB05_9HYPH|nr:MULTISPECIES: DUF1538 domain-containing protein [Methylocystis]MBG0797306.1 DUF1538 domain-containing protein [Methylocystis sp. L43]MBG0804669.1 DUF1538 domain-containing protein [Methylocystis sp. H15]AZG79061.1 DUF1538 domain-containing protein [Methylocystis rosea]MBG0792759.1 DUF1538 domain-containing protein [Methylocystis sp. H62]QGM95915.1 DUF1538 domain-containing protein [Methylocystis rosea]